MFRDLLRGLLKEHTPSMSERDEYEINLKAMDFEADPASLAQRTCSCGKPLPGYYDFIDHLLEVSGGTPLTGGS